MLRILTLAVAGLASLASAAVLPAAEPISSALTRRVVGPGKVTGSTQTHDPTLCKDGAGKYWLFSTGVGIPITTSTDRTAWTSAGVVFPSGAPAATNTFTGTSNGALWAPDCQYVNGQFRLFYAASTFGSQKSGIFYATSSTGAAGSWTDHGLVISTASGANYNAIDPNLFISSGGEWYLQMGSFWTGIKQVQIDSTGKLKSSTITALAQRSGASTAMEASVVFQYGAYYYLFTSWDKCCSGTSSTYNIRVGRSSSESGGYVDQNGVSLLNSGGTEILGTHDSIYGPGGQDIMTDTDGVIMVYHYYETSGSYLGINKLDFSSGWPQVV